MQSWKLLLGAGVACAACCAIPLLGGVTAVALGSTAWVGTSLAWGGEFAVAGATILAIGLAGLGVWWGHRRAARQAAACGCAGGGCRAQG